MRRVIVESPFAGKGDNKYEREQSAKENMRYLCRCLRDCLDRGEAPFASHGIYTRTGVLDESDPDERRLGIEAGFAWRDAAAATVVYTDLGISSGMQKGIEDSARLGIPVEFRTLTNPPWSR